MSLVLSTVGGGSGGGSSGAVLLWTNSDVSAAFGTETLNINLNPYNFFIVVHKISNGALAESPISIFTVDDVEKYIYMQSTTTNRTGGRRMQYSSSYQTLTIYGCTYNGASNNAYCIPYKIYGLNL